MTLIVFLSEAYSAGTDTELEAKLNSDLRFDVQRRNSFQNYIDDKKVFNREREKGLSLFLEEQEKWDALRDKGIGEQRQSRLKEKVMDEGSPEFKADEQLKKREAEKMEVARKSYVSTRDKVIAQFKNQVRTTEEEELDIYENRPRFDLAKRGKFKGSVGKSSSSSGSSFGGSGGYVAPPSGGSGFGSDGSAPFDYPMPPTDFTPPPSDGFEDLPPPPPMMPYDSFDGPPPFEEGAPGFDPGGGYPPPPMDGGWDF